MKKMILMFVCVLSAVVGMAAGGMNYVIVDGKSYFSEEVKVGATSVRIATDEGLTLKAPIKRVDALMVNGKLLERLPLVCPNGKEKGHVLMEFVTQRNDLRLYKCYTGIRDNDQVCCFHDSSERESMLLIYRHGEFYLWVNDRNAKTVLPFFGIQFKERS